MAKEILCGFGVDVDTALHNAAVVMVAGSAFPILLIRSEADVADRARWGGRPALRAAQP